MKYTVHALAELTGLTPRTLRWYDTIHLLKPQRGANGYRIYGKPELDRLQQILFYKEAGMELSEISKLLDTENYDAETALKMHIQNLRQRKAGLEALISSAEKTLHYLKGEYNMSDNEKFEAFKQKMVDDNEKKYGEEVRSRWGNDTADQANAKMMNMSELEYAEFARLGDEINATLAAALATGNPASQLGQQVAALHKQWLCYTWPQYNAEAHKMLAQAYVDDERFTAYYEKSGVGAAAFLRDAIVYYVDHSAE